MSGGCLKRGDWYRATEGPVNPCCPGLKPERFTTVTAEITSGTLAATCKATPQLSYVCLSCGNGTCEPEEDSCTCPVDCKGPVCLGEGKDYNATGAQDVDLCCPGLTKIKLMGYSGGQCKTPACLCWICTRCGDGKCGTGENPCNCPNDCPK